MRSVSIQPITHVQAFLIESIQSHKVVVFQLLSHVQFFATAWTVALQASLSLLPPGFCSNPYPLSSHYLILCHPLLLLPSIFPSIRVFYNELALPIRWPNYWSFSVSISPSSDYSGLISFRTDSCSTREPQESFSTPQFKSISYLVFSFLYGPTLTSIDHYRKPIALTRWTFVVKVMSLFFNTLSRFIISFLRKNKHLLIPWLQVTIHSDLGAQENKICHCYHHFPIYLP